MLFDPKLNYKTPNWDQNLMISYLEEFSSLYKSIPIKNNIGGMFFPSMFSIFLTVKFLRPTHIVESGIWKGQTTWLFESMDKKLEILSLDLNLNKREYVSNDTKRVKYSNLDFKYHDLRSFPKDSTLLFFDDHQNFLDRSIQSYFMGFKHLIFDDNYPPFLGDCYSFKKIFSNTGLQRKFSNKWKLKIIYNLFKYFSLKTFSGNRKIIEADLYNFGFSDKKPNKNEIFILNKIIDEYFELPNIFPIQKKSKENEYQLYYEQDFILEKNKINIESYPEAFNQKESFNFVTYVKLKN